MSGTLSLTMTVWGRWHDVDGDLGMDNVREVGGGEVVVAGPDDEVA